MNHLKSGNARILFLLDGYDEVCPSQRSAKTDLHNLLDGRDYIKSRLLVTSRPGVDQQIPCIPLVLRSVGFAAWESRLISSKYFFTLV